MDMVLCHYTFRSNFNVSKYVICAIMKILFNTLNAYFVL